MSPGQHHPVQHHAAQHHPVQHGFTLVELLVGMAIAMMLLTAITSFQSSSLRLSGILNEQSQRLGVLTDISGYVGSRVREASSLPDGLTLNGQVCSRAGTAPCLALILPVVNTGAGNGGITGWQLYAYRYVARSSVPASDKTLVSSWLDSNAQALYEERYAPSGAAACTGTAAPASSCFAGALPTTRVLLSDTLSLATASTTTTTSSSSSTFAPFEMQASGNVALQLRAVSLAKGEGRWSPALSAVPYSLTISPRNALP